MDEMKQTVWNSIKIMQWDILLLVDEMCQNSLGEFGFTPTHADTETVILFDFLQPINAYKRDATSYQMFKCK